ncbi:MAG: PAS domain S-box protein [Planctomycetes bacterium]|nr:PAS domain S-box protein [Planctomycetota bacterium]
MASRPRTRLLGTNRWLLSGRLVLALFSLGLATVAALNTGRWPIYRWVFLAGMAYLLLDFVYLSVTRWMEDLILFLTWQLVGDIALAGTFLYLTGGVDSPFFFLLLAVVMAAAMVLSWQRGVVFCAASVVIVWLVTAAYGLGWGVPDPSRPGGIPMGELWTISLGRSVGLLAVGMLTIVLTWRLQTVRLVSGEVLESTGEGMLVVDGNGIVMFDNGEFRSLFGFNERVDGNSTTAVLGRDEDKWLLDAIAREDETRMERNLLHHGKGKYIPVRVVFSMLGSEKGRGMIVRFEDMSVEKQLEEAERRAERYRLAADTARSIAHEVRNPLASLNVAIQELVRGLEIPQERRDLINVISYEVGRIDRIVEEFMRLARIRPPEERLAAIRGVLEEAVRILKRTEEAVETGALLEVDAPFDLTVRLDPDHLRQILLNLGLNALQAGAGKVVLSARSTGTDGAGIVEVADDGPGMDRDVLKRIFEPFFTTRTGGTGLGCAVVRKMVEDQGGRVEVDSLSGRGTTFRLFFPGDSRR